MLLKKPLLTLMFFSSMLIFSTAYAQEIPTPQQALQKFGISDAQIAQLERGEIISFDLNETSQKELAVGVAMIVPVALPQIVEFIKQGKFYTTDSNVTASGTLPNDADIGSLKKFRFNEKQLDEAKDFLNTSSGDEFNLSKAELDSLKKLQPKLADADSKTLLKTANQTYREFLLQRFKDYQKHGLSGIAAYSRDGGTADPANELRNDAINIKAWARYFPELQQAWLNYPAALPANTSERFLWLNRVVEDRPTPILNHRIMSASDAGAVVLSRQFYVGHSYNSSHVAAGCLPYKEGTLLLYSSRTSTDQVAGMGSSLKHSIGREQMRKEIIKRLQLINKELKRKPAVVAEQ